MKELNVPVDPETLTTLERIAADRGMSLQAVVSAAVSFFARKDATLLAEIQRGIADVDAGRLIGQEDMEAWFEARHQQAAAE